MALKSPEKRESDLKVSPEKDEAVKVKKKTKARAKKDAQKSIKLSKRRYDKRKNEYKDIADKDGKVAALNAAVLSKVSQDIEMGRDKEADTFNEQYKRSNTHLSPEEFDSNQIGKKLKDKLSDRLWRLNHLYHIMDEDGNDVLFVMNDVQRKIYNGLHNKTVILKSRQHGVTTFACILFLDEALFKPNVRAGIIANTSTAAERFFKDKIKYAYNHLPQEIKNAVTCRIDNRREIEFNNNSMLYVSDQMKSGTLQLLHISEYGEISKSHPDRAKSIRTDAFPTVHKNGIIIIESTAESNDGEYVNICKKAIQLLDSGTRLTVEDFKFMFYGWYDDPRNFMNDVVSISVRLQDYFKQLESQNIHLTDQQKYWYVKKEESYGETIFRQYPSTRDEAFKAAVEGTYYIREMQKVREHNKITKVEYNEYYPVDTYWDLGVDDYTAIWFMQRVGLELHFIDYYENSNEGLSHYARILDEKKYRYGHHVAPHDINVRNLGEEAETRLQIAGRLGVHFVVANSISIADGIEATRTMLSMAWFDEEKCEMGIKCLDNYRKAWDAKNGQWKNNPQHNEYSHGADAMRMCAIMWKELYASPRSTVRPVKIQAPSSASWS